MNLKKKPSSTVITHTKLIGKGGGYHRSSSSFVTKVATLLLLILSILVIIYYSISAIDHHAKVAKLDSLSSTTSQEVKINDNNKGIMMSSLTSSKQQQEAQDTTTTTAKFGGFKYEIFGKVQGVFFRKYTEKKANELNVLGWIRNTYRGTVEGVIISSNENNDIKVRNEMKVWLQTIGSPKSMIDHGEFITLDIDSENDKSIIDEILQQDVRFEIKKTTKSKQRKK